MSRIFLIMSDATALSGIGKVKPIMPSDSWFWADVLVDSGLVVSAIVVVWSF